MPPISMKRILIAILMVVALSQIDTVMLFLAQIYHFFDDSLEPIREFSPQEQYVVTLLLGALLYITIFKLRYNRK